MITHIIALSLAYCPTASDMYGRGPYGRVMQDPGYTQMEGDTQGYEDLTLDKVSS